LISGGEAVGVNAVSSNIHVIGSDPIFGGGTVIHANGQPVSSGNPARPGEQLVMYAFGLGVTDPPAKTGEAGPVSPLAKKTVVLNFDFRANARPSPLALSAQDTAPRPNFAGLAPGFVGLYQINFAIPLTVPGSL